MPNLLFGKSISSKDYPPQTDEQKAKLSEFFTTIASPSNTAARMPGIVKDISERTGGTIKKWGVLGMCWGGKVGSPSTG